MNPESPKKQQSFQLKASLYTLTTLMLLDSDLSPLDEQLAKLRQQAPKFFNSAPVIIDLQRLPKATACIDFVALKQIVEKHQLVIVGLRHASEPLQVAARSAGFAILPEAMANKSAGAHSSDRIVSPAPKEAATSLPEMVKELSAPEVAVATAASEITKIITQPVRSGQQIYAKNGDLVVLAPVSPGAELLADGNIHVYGALRGRVLAGAQGNNTARIFCHQLEAELVSIAGHYWLHDDLQQYRLQGPVQIYLKGDQLQIEKL
jgi:septum site-determining protein MinC